MCRARPRSALTRSFAVARWCSTRWWRGFIRFCLALAVDSVDLRAQLLSAQQRLASLMVRGPEGQAAERYSMLLDEARTAKEETERVLAERSAGFHAELSYERAGLDDVRRAMPAGSVARVIRPLPPGGVQRAAGLERSHTARTGCPVISRLCEIGTKGASRVRFGAASRRCARRSMALRRSGRFSKRFDSSHRATDAADPARMPGRDFAARSGIRSGRSC